MPSEKYRGPKFKCKLSRSHIAKGGILKKILSLVNSTSKLRGIAESHSNEGNASIRTSEGFLIKCAGASFFTRNPSNFSLVRGFSRKDFTILAAGPKPPSSESLMHALIYQKRPDINSIFHIHSKKLLSRAPSLGIRTTSRSHPYGSKALAREAALSLAYTDVIALKDHGVIAVGNSPSAALTLLKHLLHSL